MKPNRRLSPHLLESAHDSQVHACSTRLQPAKNSTRQAVCGLLLPSSLHFTTSGQTQMLAKEEGLDEEASGVVELAALLHDVKDWKYSGSSKANGQAVQVRQEGAVATRPMHACSLGRKGSAPATHCRGCHVHGVCTLFLSRALALAPLAHRSSCSPRVRHRPWWRG